jgi:hypothetical protein
VSRKRNDEGGRGEVYEEEKGEEKEDEKEEKLRQ